MCGPVISNGHACLQITHHRCTASRATTASMYMGPHAAASTCPSPLISLLFSRFVLQLYNSREGLLGQVLTDYTPIKKLMDQFEPFYSFWTTAASWKVGMKKYPSKIRLCLPFQLPGLLPGWDCSYLGGQDIGALAHACAMISRLCMPLLGGLCTVCLKRGTDNGQVMLRWE